MGPWTFWERSRQKLGREGPTTRKDQRPTESVEASDSSPSRGGSADAGDILEESTEQVWAEQDDERDGLHTLYPPITSGAPTPASMDVDIVAIHGLGGDPYNTWKDSKTASIWLRDFLPGDLPNSHIMSFGYRSGVAFSGSVSNIDDYARALLEALMARRIRVQTERKPLIFICHSLGGIVFKKALIIAHGKQSRYASLLSLIKGVVFFGTPHHGADYAYWGRVIGTIVNLRFLNLVRKDLLEDLDRRSAVLGDICMQFVERAVPLHIVTIYERQKLRGLNQLIVDKDSAVMNLPNETVKPIEADHISMCKFRSSSSHQYEYVVASIIELYKFIMEHSEQLQRSPEQPLSHNENGDASDAQPSRCIDARDSAFTFGGVAGMKPYVADFTGKETERRHTGYIFSKAGSKRRRSDESECEDKRTRALLKAASEGQMPLVERLLDLGVYLDYADDNGFIALHQAVLSGSEDVVTVLLKVGSDINTVSLNLITPLCLAVSSTKNSMVKLLLNNNAQVNHQGSEGRTALHTAAAIACEEDIIETLLIGGANIHLLDNKKKAPLHYAVEVGSTLVVKRLLQHGANPSAKDGVGETALHYAAKGSCAELVRLLLAFDADPEIVNNDGKTATNCLPDDACTELSSLLTHGNQQDDRRIPHKIYQPLRKSHPIRFALKPEIHSSIRENTKRVIDLLNRPLSDRAYISRASVYALYDPDLDLVKFGMTHQSVDQRCRQLMISYGMSSPGLEVIHYESDMPGYICQRMEALINQDLSLHQRSVSLIPRRRGSLQRTDHDWYSISRIEASQTLKMWRRVFSLNPYHTPRSDGPGTLRKVWVTRLREQEPASESETLDNHHERRRRWKAVFRLDEGK